MITKIETNDSLITVWTELSISDIETQGLKMETALAAAGLDYELTGSVVARQLLKERFSTWFKNSEKVNWAFHFNQIEALNGKTACLDIHWQAVECFERDGFQVKWYFPQDFDVSCFGTAERFIDHFGLSGGQ